MKAAAYEAVVIGTGQSGKPLALALARAGWKVSVIEREHVGGTCINVGCTPTKTMVASGRVAYTPQNPTEESGELSKNPGLSLSIGRAHV